METVEAEERREGRKVRKIGGKGWYLKTCPGGCDLGRATSSRAIPSELKLLIRSALIFVGPRTGLDHNKPGWPGEAEG